MRKRILSGILSLLVVLTIFVPTLPVYASMTAHNTAGGAGSASKAGNWSEKYSFAV